MNRVTDVGVDIYEILTEFFAGVEYYLGPVPYHKWSEVPYGPIIKFQSDYCTVTRASSTTFLYSRLMSHDPQEEIVAQSAFLRPPNIYDKTIGYV